ncbi:protease pro-enzyme activation domain-containing protein [Stygiolobus caldivivus]|uniref:Pseudomonapepsin n=1 Tax=Stygiolobus caldivivus TaxID=2824673 RepID=A0A8D5ZDY8_9CREN|nr:protease pro-enzyme activation domain-containing protein [Stygiolobus caldivivus]BCU69373.1 pseudomonapepsin [Stygiolobus caldivivus]
MIKTHSVILLILFMINALVFLGISTSAYATYVGPKIDNSQFIGQLNPQQMICIGVLIPPKNMNQLYLLAQEVAYHQIKPIPMNRLISMFAQTYKEGQIISFLEDNGLQIVYKSPFAIIAQGYVYQVNNAFHVTLGLYKDGNIIFYMPTSKPEVPPVFSGVMLQGLTNFTSASLQLNLIKLGKVEGNSIIPDVNPLIENLTGFKYLSFAANMYSPQDLVGAYNITQGGKNVSIAIIDAYGDPTILQDVKLFDQKFHLPPANISIIPIGPYHPIFGIFEGWCAETALDVETAHAIAPYAHIDLVVPSSTLFIPEAIDYIVSNDIAQVVSMSFGIPENVLGDTGLFYVYQGTAYPNTPYWDYYFALGTVEGITFLASSGDSGATAEGLSTYSGVSYPATSPFVTGVGGTTLFVNVTSGYLSQENSTATYGYETAWSVDNMFYFPYVASDGGYSELYPKPWYQYGINGTLRASPDVAADANPYTGEIIYVLGQEEVIGGTSLASPLWAGVVADVISQTHKPVGLLNNILYWIYSNSSLYQKVFHQVDFGFNGLYTAHKGYNPVTGLGTPDYYWLLKAVEAYEKIPKLSVSVTVSEPGVQYPWFMYNSTFTIIAKISYPNSTQVTSGSFTAYIYTTQGLLTSMPMIFNGTYWEAVYTIKPGSPPNIWYVVVNGTSGGISGSGAYEIDVGLSIDIISPTPFPYALSIPPNTPFSILACVYYPNLTPAIVPLHAYFVQDGKIVYNVTLLPTSAAGLYKGTFAVLTPSKEGVFIMFVNDSYGSAFSYETIGGINEEVLVFTPIDDGFPSITPGENVTIISFTYDQSGLGIFTSNVTAYVYSPDGKLIGAVNLTPATEITQFGVYNLFGYHEGNFTIPSNASSGFYTVVVEASYNSSIGLEEMNYTTFFYVAPSTASVQVRSLNEVFEGEYVKVYANITYPNGTEITTGIFTVTLIPYQNENQQILLEFDNGVPLQYNSTLREWVGLLRAPGGINATVYQGNPIYSLTGPWKVAVAGTSYSGYNSLSIGGYVEVMPYVYLPPLNLTPSTLVNLPLVLSVNNSYTIQGVYAPSLSLSNGNFTIQGSILGTLYISNATVTIEGSTISSIKVINSQLVLINSKIEDSNIGIYSVNSNVTLSTVTFNNVDLAIDYVHSNIENYDVSFVHVTKMSEYPVPKLLYPFQITSLTSYITVNITNYNTSTLKIMKVTVDGRQVNYTVTQGNNGIEVRIPFNSSEIPSGENMVSIEAYNGMHYNLSFSVDNEYPLSSLTSSVSSAVNSTRTLSLALGLVAIILSVLAIIISFRKGGGKNVK